MSKLSWEDVDEEYNGEHKKNKKYSNSKYKKKSIKEKSKKFKTIF